MNRPFYAIGVLLAALAGAMLLISATSRPRGPQPAAAAPSGKGHWQPIRPRGTNFVLVLAAEDGEEEAVGLEALGIEVAIPDAGLLAAGPSFDMGCGLDRATGQVYPQPLGIGEADSAEPKTGYDPAYDAAMFGIAWDADSRPEFLPAISIEPELLEDLDPALRLMRDLLKERPDALRRPKIRRSRLAGTSDERPTWDDYELWANSQQTVAEQGTAAAVSPQSHAVPVFRIRRLAAETLQGMAKLLHAAAQHLNDLPADEVAATPAKANQK